MNKVILVGLVGSDAELKHTQGGTAIAKFRMATSRKRGGSDETQWHNIVLFGKSAENLTQWLVKGKQVGVDGRLEYRTFDKADGSKGYQTDIIAEDVQLLGGGQERRGGQQRTQQTSGPGVAQAASADSNDGWGIGPADDKDVPF